MNAVDVRGEGGFLMIEMTAAIVILSFALLALMAGFDSAFLSLHKSDQKATASTLANQQLELYRALPYNSIGLDKTTTQNVGDSSNAAYDSTYTTNSLLDGDFVPDPNDPNTLIQNPSGTVNEIMINGCGTAANCEPIQSVTGPDHRHYRIETYVRDRPNNTAITWSERVVTVVVQDADQSSFPTIFQMETAFDQGAPSG
jgi:type II secretory pathway pseudopilin PulG